MKRFTLLLAFAVAVYPVTADAQSTVDEELKITALEALIAAPPERALPIVRRVLAGDNSEDVKSRAMFVLSQLESAEAHALLLDVARSSAGELQEEAIRMIAIGGNADAMAGLADIYRSGGVHTKDAVLEAYLIADDADSVYQIAAATDDPDEFEEAVETLGAMGATEQLRLLRERTDMAESLIEAFAIAEDVESLRALASDGSDPDVQAEAIEALGIVGGSEVNSLLVDIYRNASSDEVREAALDGMLISGYDEGVLTLFNEADDPETKRELLEQLIVMDSEFVWEIVDATLE